MATIITLPTSRRRQTLVTTSWSRTPRAVTVLAMAMAALLSLGSLDGVTDAFLAHGAASASYITSPSA